VTLIGGGEHISGAAARANSTDHGGGSAGRSSLPSRRLEVELTEGALVANFELAREVLIELKELGVRLALNDFCTGRSSLLHLQMLPFDRINRLIPATESVTLLGIPESACV
jgi:predicted signal transduction protein with EAL and GGDEF domain